MRHHHSIPPFFRLYRHNRLSILLEHKRTFSGALVASSVASVDIISVLAGALVQLCRFAREYLHLWKQLKHIVDIVNLLNHGVPHVATPTPPSSSAPKHCHDPHLLRRSCCYWCFVHDYYYYHHEEIKLSHHHGSTTPRIQARTQSQDWYHVGTITYGSTRTGT